MFQLSLLSLSVCRSDFQALEDGTDRGFRNVGRTQMDAGDIPKRMHTIITLKHLVIYFVLFMRAKFYIEWLFLSWITLHSGFWWNLLCQYEWKSITLPSAKVNPPYHVPLVEVVPAPWTEESVVMKTRDIMKEVGQVPVCFKREIEGFALNRIQWVSLTSSYKY